jgi:hypothetical protein
VPIGVPLFLAGLLAMPAFGPGSNVESLHVARYSQARGAREGRDRSSLTSLASLESLWPW